jgi:hypothetical protein
MKCEECNKKGGHEIWCCLSRETAEMPASREWGGFNPEGVRVALGTFPAHVDADFVLSYMKKDALGWQNIVRVEVL